MQKWYNGLSKGQRIIIAISMFAILWLVGIVFIHKGIAILMGLLGLLLCLFLELGRKK